MNPGWSGMWGPDGPRVKSLLSGNSQGMGSASPLEPEKDMEGYYNLLQAGSELENTLQREYMSLKPVSQDVQWYSKDYVCYL